MNTRKEMRKCQKCQAEYECTIVSHNGKEWFGKVCDNCAKKEKEERWANEYKVDRDKKEIEVRQSWAVECGVAGIFMEKTFDNFKAQLNIKAFNAVKNYNGKSITLLSPGTYGVGKTHLVCALANSLIKTSPAVTDRKMNYADRNSCPVFFTTESVMLNRIRATFNPKYSDSETEEEVYNKLTFIPLLIIDDVGKIQPKDYSFLQSVYYRVIDTRWVNELPIILTTNLDYAQLEQHIGGASADRLKGMCGDNMIKMAGKSQR